MLLIITADYALTHGCSAISIVAATAPAAFWASLFLPVLARGPQLKRRKCLEGHSSSVFLIKVYRVFVRSSYPLFKVFSR